MGLRQTKANRATGRAAPRDKESRAAKARLLAFTRKFLLAAALTVIPISIVPEAWFAPLNRFTTLMVADVLRLLAAAPVVRGALISVGGFSVRIIAECSAVHLVALYAAFVFAFPAGRAQKWIGLGAGTALILTVNVLRIAVVISIGRRFPDLFEVAHVYLGQLGMVITMIVICLAWCQWISGPERRNGPAGFLLRFLIFSSLPFLLWVPLNKIYMGAIDGLVQWLFGLASQRIAIPRDHQLYYQTFSLITLSGLLLAVKGPGMAMRLRWIVCGCGVLILCQIAIRLCNAWIAAFQIGWLAPVSQIVYNLCVYALPLAVALCFLMHMRPWLPAVLSKGRSAEAPDEAGTPS